MDRNTTDAHMSAAEQPGRRPRVALMGEFSAGKSTLSNLLLGCDPLPVRITATSVPPVWISHGERAATLVRHDGTEETMKADELSNATLEIARLIRLKLPSDILEYCNLLDMPGISDPNLEHDAWNDLIDETDCILWCTHATQAWRQSEAAVWEALTDRTNGNNLLVVTQFDKLKSELDRTRVLARLGKETNGAFQAIFPVSLIEALDSGDDEKAWKLSGADEFVRYFVDMLLAQPILAEDVADMQSGARHQMQNKEYQEHTGDTKAVGELIPDVHEMNDDPKISPKRVCNEPGARPRTRPANPAVAVGPSDRRAEASAHGE